MDNIKAIFFDFDGTLANTAPGIVATMRETFKRMNMPIPEEQAMRQTIGIPLVKALQLLQNLNDERAKEAEQVYCDLFETYEIRETTIFPHVAETLEALANRGVRMAVVTSRDKYSLELILGKYDLTDNFEELVTHDNYLTPKPSPDMVLYLLDKMNLKPEEAMVVGDTTYDIQMGNRAGCMTCAVTYGNHGLEILKSSEPDFIVDDIEEVIKSGIPMSGASDGGCS